jgi:hypothetical protein
MSRGVSSAGVLIVSVLTPLLTGATGASSVEAPHPAHSRGGGLRRRGGEVRWDRFPAKGGTGSARRCRFAPPRTRGTYREAKQRPRGTARGCEGLASPVRGEN